MLLFTPNATLRKRFTPEIPFLNKINSQHENLVGRIEDDPIAQQLPDRPTFIPLRQADLKSGLVDLYSLQDADLDSFQKLCDRVGALFHVEHQTTLLRLEKIYELLDPDTQLLAMESLGKEKLDAVGDQLIDQVSGLLFSAHYKRLTRKEIQRAIDVGWQWGVKLEVDFELFDRLEIFARGYRKVDIHRRRWQRAFLKETIELPEFTRLIMVFRVKEEPENKKKDARGKLDSRFVYLKTFKDIPESEVEILLPGSKIRLTKMDRAKILFPTLSGLAITIYKFSRSALLLTLAFSWGMIFGWTVLIGGSIGYIVKSVMSYFRTKKNYQSGLTKNLYLKNLDNNLGVLYRILNEAEEQEVSETILAYTVLWKHPEFRDSGARFRQLDEAVEAFIKSSVCRALDDENTTGQCEHRAADVDFEVHDALGKLARLGLATVDREGYWKAVPIEQATDTIADRWKQLLP